MDEVFTMNSLLSDQNSKNECSICGVSEKETRLVYSHLTPKYLTKNSRGKNDLILVCENCNTTLDYGTKEIEFIDFLYHILISSNKFNKIEREPVIGDDRKYRPDILITDEVNKEYIIIECKSKRAFSRLQNKMIIEQLGNYKNILKNSKQVFAFPSRFPHEARTEFIENDITVWDMDYILEHFYEQILDAPISIFRSYFLTAYSGDYNSKKEKTLLEKLHECKPGKQEWSIYQKLVGEILDVYFSPSLDKPISELSDFTKSNRRDFILPNYSNDGFWKFMREKYSADYVVVDAKNYVGKINKKEVLQIANYLKTYGAGMFAIIFSRNGGDKTGCLHTLREQWMLHGKMIIILDDYDIESILKAQDKKVVEEVIGSKIQEFRLSM